MRFVVALIAVVVLGGCGTATTQPVAPNPAPTPQPGWVLVTEHDQAISVHVGQKLEVFLSQRQGMNPWSPITVDDQSVLQPVPTGITAVRGVTVAGFAAVQPGTATITSYAGPLCSPGQACPMYVMLFSAKVTVTG